MPKSNSPAISPEQFTTFGELLKFLRHRAGLTQLELSIAVNYSEGQISHLEHNHRAPEVTVIAARFVPALGLEKEPEWTARLMELAGANRKDAQPETAARAATLPPHNLPTQLTSFVGRETDLARIAARLNNPDCRLLTLVGTGGIGKTRLALQAAASQLSRIPDGVYFVPLAPLAPNQAELIVSAIAHALAFKLTSRTHPQEQLLEHLGGKQLLLVLDNFEHLRGAGLVIEILRAAPQLKLMITSREPLNLQAEWQLRVAGLDFPRTVVDAAQLREFSAVQLFLERVNRIDPDFSPDASSVGAVLQLCARVEGMPLALELAASRTRSLSVVAIAEGVMQGIDMLRTTMLDIDPRHSSLRAVLDWSFSLLNDAERALLLRLAVFRGGWTVEAAAAVGVGGAVAGGSVQALLGELTAQSLVLREENSAGTWYRMLEPIRQYVEEKFAVSEEDEGVRRRHAEYYLTLVNEGIPVAAPEYPKPEWFRRMEPERDNLRAALAWSQKTPGEVNTGLGLALASPWLLEDSETSMWMKELLARAELNGGADPWARGRVLLELGIYSTDSGDNAAGQVQFEESLRYFRESGNRAWELISLERLGWVARERDDLPTARARLEEGLALARRLGNAEVSAAVGNTLAHTLIMQGEMEQAKNLLRENLELERQLGNAYTKGYTLNHLAIAAQIEGDVDNAVRLHEQAVAIFTEMSPVSGQVAGALYCLGEAELGQGDTTSAAKHLGHALKLAQDLTFPKCAAWCLGGLAGVAALNEEPERAVFLWAAAETLRQSIGARQTPESGATRERLMALVRTQLGDEAFAAAWARGEAAPLAQVMELVRSD